MQTVPVWQVPSTDAGGVLVDDATIRLFHLPGGVTWLCFQYWVEEGLVAVGLSFSWVQGFRFTASPHGLWTDFHADDGGIFNALTEVEASPWLEELTASGRRYTRQPHYRVQHHYAIYLHDRGLYEFAAAGCRLLDAYELARSAAFTTGTA